MKKLAFLILVISLSGCSTTGQQRLSSFLNSPAGKAIVATAATAGANAIDQFAASGKVDAKEVAKAALGGASAELRKAQTPDATLSAAEAKAAAATAVKEGTGVTSVSNKVAPAVAKAVADAVKNQGAPADLALEAAAQGLDKAVAEKK